MKWPYTTPKLCLASPKQRNHSVLWLGQTKVFERSNLSPTIHQVILFKPMHQGANRQKKKEEINYLHALLGVL